MTQAKRHHPDILTRFKQVDGHLLIAGQNLEKIIASAGGTPLFIYDGDLIRDRIAQLRATLPDKLHLSYAVKANPFPPVIKLLAELVDGFDVASAGELDLALAAGMPPRCISFAGPGKTDSELSLAIRHDVLIVVESEGELQRLTSLAGSKKARAAIRVNPAFELRQAGMRMSGGPSPFGIDAERAPQILSHWPESIKFEGLHIFAGSQNLSEAALIQTFSATFALLHKLSESAPGPMVYANIGGGLGIPYFPGDTPLSLSKLGEELAPLFDDFCARHHDVQLVMELGRFLVGEAGLYVTRVLDVKDSRDRRFVVVDGGLHHHLAASGNFGQVIRRNYPVAIDGKLNTDKYVVQTISGRLCTPLDVLWDNAPLPEAQVGDLVVLFQSGAYGASASPAWFLGHGPAQETLVCSG